MSDTLSFPDPDPRQSARDLFFRGQDSVGPVLICLTNEARVFCYSDTHGSQAKGFYKKHRSEIEAVAQNVYEHRPRDEVILIRCEDVKRWRQSTANA